MANILFSPHCFNVYVCVQVTRYEESLAHAHAELEKNQTQFRKVQEQVRYQRV